MGNLPTIQDVTYPEPFLSCIIFALVECPDFDAFASPSMFSLDALHSALYSF